MTSYVYDVALSFAGEDRDFVKQVADLLRSNGIRVFYDEFERSNLWGKELIEYLEDIYKNKSRYVIIFSSKSYLKKDWTNHERKSALNRAFKEKGEYILPIMLDETKLPGLHESIGYLSGQNQSPIDIVDIFLDKIGVPNTSVLEPSLLLYRVVSGKFAKDLSGIGASLAGSRWNSKGKRMFHTSTNIALATLEIIVHIPSGDFLSNLNLVQYAIPAKVNISTVYISDLPLDWNSVPYSRMTQEIGDTWLNQRESCILSVPSAIVPQERIYLLNPEYPDFEKLRINKIDDFEFDKRLFR